MSTNAPTSRRITYMHCHVDGVSLEVIFFFLKKKKNYFPLLFPNSTSFSFLLYTLNHLSIRFPSYFTLSIPSNLSSLYTFFYIYKGDNSWETWLELFFQRAFLVFGCSSTQLEKPDLNSPWEIFTSSNL